MAIMEYCPHVIQENADKLRKQSPSTSDHPTALYLYLKATGQVNSDEFRSSWRSNTKSYEEWRALVTPSLEVTHLPSGSFLLQFTFSLEKPYLSGDDNDFYIIDNPVVRDKVFRWPMVRPSSWKGSLRHALWQLSYKKNHEQIQRIFGDIRDDNTGKAGRLSLYPTFFDKTDLEIINPHSRSDRVGKNPILFESVPRNSRGTFTVLYVPFDRVGENRSETFLEVADDLRLIFDGIKAMMTVYGFGAKTSSGFGLATNQLQKERSLQVVGLVDRKGSSAEAKSPNSPPADYLLAEDEVHPDFLTDEGKPVSEAQYCQLLKARGESFNKRRKKTFKGFVRWCNAEGKAIIEKAAQLANAPKETEAPKRAIAKRTDFFTWDKLQEVIEELIQLMKGAEK